MAQVSIEPKILPAVFTADECDTMIEIAERDEWIVTSDSVDKEPAWEFDLLPYAAGKIAASRTRGIISEFAGDITLKRYQIHVRKYGPQIRASLAPHHDRSTLSFTVALNDDYLGGEFYYINAGNGEQIVTLSRGDAVMFGGNVMHGIYPVREGIRYSLVMHCV